MAVDYGMLSRIPSFGARFAAGQEAGRAAAAQNMLLQQRQMEFQQAQEDRRLAAQERQRKLDVEQTQIARRGQLAQVLRQSGMDPSDMQAATQFYAAALEANEPTAIAAAKDWLSLARETAQSRAAGAEYQGIMGGGAPAAAPTPMATPMAAAPAPMAAPMTAPAPQQLSPLAVEQAAYQRPEFYGQGQFAGTAPTAVTSPVGEFPSAPPSVNAMAPAAPPVNQLAAAPAPPPAAAPTPAPAKDDAAALRAEAQRLEAQQQRLRQSSFKANQERAKDLDKPIERLYKRAEDVEKAAKPAEAPADLRTMDALGIPRTEAGFARFNELKQRPEAMSALSRLIVERDRLPPTDPNRKLYDEAIKKATTQVEGTKVEVKLPEQEKAFETELGRGQAKKLLDDKAVADDARSIIDTVQQGRQLLQSGMITGFGAEALTQIGAALNQAGISFASDSVANTQAFAANMAANVGRIIKQFGAGTGLSNADREYAEKMAGGKITLDRKAIERILDINERAARNVITAHNKRVAGVKTNVPLTVELPPAMPTAPAAAPAGRPSLEQIFQPPKR